MSAGREGENEVWGLISSLVGGPAVWGAIGFGVDRLLDTSAFLPVGVVVGFVTGFYIVYVKSQHQNAQHQKTAPQKTATGSVDSRPAAARTDTGDDAPS